MNLQPSLSVQYNERRLLFAKELEFGGHGQLYLSGNTTVYPDPDYIFYQVDFLTNSTLISAGFRSYNDNNQLIYNADNVGAITFPANYTWNAPLTSISLNSGTAIAYQYKKFIPEDLFCV